MSTKDMATQESIEVNSVGGVDSTKAGPLTPSPLDIEMPDNSEVQSMRRELARDFVTLKHTISQLRSERDRLSVENRDLKMRLAAIETDYTNLFSYVEGRKAEA
ncbi:MAG: hypothetical protein L7S67_05610 [Flavobacteriales bacterium]|nr:hypothetical protein [Flavobacteriales bacterium]